MALKIVCTLCGAEAPLDVCPDCSQPKAATSEFSEQEMSRVNQHSAAFARTFFRTHGKEDTEALVILLQQYMLNSEVE